MRRSAVALGGGDPPPAPPAARGVGSRAAAAVVAAASIVLTLLLPIRGEGASPPRFEAAALEGLQAQLDLERRGRQMDVDELERLTDSVAKASSDAASARTRMLRTIRDGDPDARVLSGAEEDISEAEARVRAAEDRRRALAARLVERSRHMALLSEEIQKRRANLRSVDPVSGRWEVYINPGNRRGVYRLVLDGTLVAGDYSLDGSFRGSLRGTYVGDKITLQRIDSERGLDATFYGRLSRADKKMTGTWEATQLAPAIGPTAGTWAASQLPDRDEGELEKP